LIGLEYLALWWYISKTPNSVENSPSTVILSLAWRDLRSKAQQHTMSTIKATHTASGILLASVAASETSSVEGNYYIPESALKVALPGKDEAHTHLLPSETHYHCPWKGQSSYYNLVTEDGKTVKDVAWYYADPSKKAIEKGVTQDKVAFDKGQVKVVVE
jgi:uncharacterized protein (DUF427 family)